MLTLEQMVLDLGGVYIEPRDEGIFIASCDFSWTWFMEDGPEEATVEQAIRSLWEAQQC